MEKVMQSEYTTQEVVFTTGDWIAICASIITLLLGIATIVVTILSNKKQGERNYITNSRQQWLNKLKGLISDFYSEVKYYENKAIPNDISEYIQRLYYLSAQIKLQLNFCGNADNEITNCLDEIIRGYSYILHYSLRGQKDNCIEQLQYICDNCDSFFREHACHMIEKHKLDITGEKRIQYLQEYCAGNHYEEIIADLNVFHNNCFVIMKKYSELLLIYTEIYAKVEWERIKEEASKGLDRNFDFEKQYNDLKQKKKKDIDAIKAEIKKFDN